MHWSAKELYQIAYIVHRGWEYDDCGTGGWVKEGHIREENRHASYDDRESERERKLFRLDNAFWEAYADEGEPTTESDTIPSPPHPEIGLLSTLQDLCVWYEDEALDISPRLKAGLPHDLFLQIARHIGYEMKG